MARDLASSWRTLTQRTVESAAGAALQSEWLEDLVAPSLTVQTLMGHKLRYKLQDCPDVSELKFRIFRDEGIPTEQMRIVCAGRQLTDEMRTEPGIYHLILRLRGGMGDRFRIDRKIRTSEVRVELRRQFVDWGAGPLEDDEADVAFMRLTDRLLSLTSPERHDLLAVEVFTDAALAAYAPDAAPLRGERVAGTVRIAKIDISLAARQARGLTFEFKVVMSFTPELSFPPGTRLRAEIAPRFVAEIAALHEPREIDAPRGCFAWFARVGGRDWEGENVDLRDYFSNY